MELKKLHMGTVSYGLDSIDEVQNNLITGFQQHFQSNYYNI